MNKGILKGATSILLFPLKIIRLFSLGLFFTSYIIIGFVVTSVSKVIGYCFRGIVVVGIFANQILHHVTYALSLPFIAYHNHSVHRKEKIRKMSEELAKRAAQMEELQRQERERAIAARKAKADENKRRKERDVYINENVKLEKKTFGDKINDFLVAFVEFPRQIIAKIKDKIHNSDLARNRRNKADIERNALLMNFEGEDAEKSETKQLYEYEARDPNGKYVKETFEAFSKVEVHSYLLAEGYTVYSIRLASDIKKQIHGLMGGGRIKMKPKDLIFFLTQLSTYIKAGIPLVEALRILERQYKKKGYHRVFRMMIYDLTMGENFSAAMEKQGSVFPSLLVNMVKTAEMTGSLPEVLDDMANYYTETDKTRKEMVTAMIYPSIVMVVAVGVTVFIMMFVVPKFVAIYESMDASQIPGITLWIMGMSSFLQKNFWFILIGVVLFAFLIAYCYRNVRLIKTFIQWTLMHIPVAKDIIIYNEVTMFTKTFASLLEHNVFITESMDILNKITNNEIYRMLILDTITNLAKGDKISTAFKGHWAFPIPAYEMLVTGEKTGELPQMMRKVSEYYQELHRNQVSRIKTFIEPVLIIFLTVVVGIIILSIVIPMFNMYNTIQQV